MAYKRISPVPIIEGGTGTSSLTNGGVLVGSGTAAIDALAVGTTGQLLVAVTGSDPAFASSASADFTFTSATASVVRTLTVSNTDDTAAATSAAKVQVTVGGANVGDPTTSYTVTGATTFTQGIDNSDSDRYKLSASTALGTTDVMVTTTAGEITKPLQPTFLAYPSAVLSNVTGNGAAYTNIYNTEIFDVNSDYNNATGVFTAPVTGIYSFFHAIQYQAQLTTGGLIMQVYIVTSNRTYYVYTMPTRNTIPSFGGGNLSLVPCEYVLADMDAGDTATLVILATGGSGNNDDIIQSTATSVTTCMNGFLVC